MQPVGISVHLYINSPDVLPKVLEVLKEAKRLGYIERIFDKEEAQALHLTGAFEYVVESCPFISLSNEVDGEIVNQVG